MLQTQKIYCRDCYDHFRLYVRLERTFGVEQIQSAAWISLPFVLLCGAIYGLYYVDRILKSQSFVSAYKDQDNSPRSDQLQLDTELESDVITFERAFELVNQPRIMAPIYVVLVIIFLWCYYMRFSGVLGTRGRVIFVEVQDATTEGQSISRN